MKLINQRILNICFNEMLTTVLGVLVNKLDIKFFNYKLIESISTY